MTLGIKAAKIGSGSSGSVVVVAVVLLLCNSEGRRS